MARAGCRRFTITTEHGIRMIFDNSVEGHRGQDAASYFLRSFFDLGPLTPDPGIDFVGYYRKSAIRRPIAFQVKKSSRFVFRSRVLARWLASIDVQPVILFRVVPVPPRRIRYFFKVLHEWMLDHQDWVLHLRATTWTTIDLDEFVEVDDDNNNFLVAVETELSRVQGEDLSLWITRKWRGLPISSSELFGLFGHLAKLELNAETLSEMVKVLSPSWQESQWSAFRREVDNKSGRTLGFVADWRRQLSEPALPATVEAEMMAFKDFVAAMRSFQNGSSFDLPTTTWRNISPWRTFCQLYPRSLDMLEAYIAEPRRWANSTRSLGTAFNLITTMANSEDPVMMERSRQIIAGVQDAFSAGVVGTYEEYRVVANYFAACQEVELEPYADQCLDFHRRHSEDWQLRWQREYYQGNDFESARAALHKLAHPNLRNLKAVDLDEWRLTLLQGRGVRVSGSS